MRSKALRKRPTLSRTKTSLFLKSDSRPGALELEHDEHIIIVDEIDGGGTRWHLSILLSKCFSGVLWYA